MSEYLYLKIYLRKLYSELKECNRNIPINRQDTVNNKI